MSRAMSVVQIIVRSVLGVFLAALLIFSGHARVEAQGESCLTREENQTRQRQLSPTLMSMEQCQCKTSGFPSTKRCNWYQVSTWPIQPTPRSATATPRPTATQTRAAGPARSATATPWPTATETRAAGPAPTNTASAALRSVFATDSITTFESFGTWRRGDEQWGTFVQSSEQRAGGGFSGKLAYNFPAVENNYVVFRQIMDLDFTPDALRVKVYGDGSQHFLNTWVEDARGQLWQFTFGQVHHQGWQTMEAPLDLGRGWPNQAIGAASTQAPVSPLRFYALVFDGHTSGRTFQGAVYLDDLEAVVFPGSANAIASQMRKVEPATAVPTRIPPTATDTPAPTSTPVPTSTALPTATNVPTLAPTAAPSVTPTALPAATAQPTLTPPPATSPAIAPATVAAPTVTPLAGPSAPATPGSSLGTLGGFLIGVGSVGGIALVAMFLVTRRGRK